MKPSGRWLSPLRAQWLSDVQELITHLDRRSFRKGLLTARLEAVDLSSLTPEDARALGIAVGRRTVRLTFLVRIEGVEPAIGYPERYPAAYRAGLVYGLLFNEQGALCTQATAVSLVIDLLLVDDQLAVLLSEIAPIIGLDPSCARGINSDADSRGGCQSGARCGEPTASRRSRHMDAGLGSIKLSG